ncbi:MAG: ATP synthase F0 subunit B [Deltaproteobacteria bacterium]|nr:ATP synthase F0 subunit B [Deltaproteobacteria bacterium]
METSVVIASVLNFSVMVGVFGFFGRKPFASFLVSRSEAVKKAIDEAEKLVQEARQELLTWESNWRQAHSHAEQDRNNGVASLKRFKDKILFEATHEAERIKKEAELLSSGEILKAKKGLQTEAIERSVELAELYLGEHLPAQEKHKLVTEFVGLVGHGTR